MKGRYAIIGLGSFGASLAKNLVAGGAEVTLMDKDREKVEELKDLADAALILDATDMHAMRAQELEDMDGVIIALGDDFGETVLIQALLMDLGVKNIYVRVTSERERSIVLRLGAVAAIFPAEIAGRNLARGLRLGGRISTMPVGAGYSMVQVPVPGDFIGRTIGSLRLRQDLGLNLVTVLEPRNSGDEEPRCCGVPKPDRILEKDEHLILFGSEANLSAFLLKNSS